LKGQTANLNDKSLLKHEKDYHDGRKSELDLQNTREGKKKVSSK